MSWSDFWRGSLFRKPDAPSPTVRAPLAAAIPRTKMGGRLSLDNLTTPLFGGFGTILSPDDYDKEWRTLNLDSRTLANVSTNKLLQMLADLSPDVSKALWDFLRATNSGWECVAYRPGTDTVDEAATASLLAFLGTLDDLYGSVDVVFGRLFFAAFLRGSFAMELVLDEAGRVPLDLATPDPASFRFRRVADPVRGAVWEMGQWQGGRFVVFDRPTVRYVPIDPFPGNPYGRPMAAPALFSALFLLGLFHDLRRVIAQQGYPRLDVAISVESLQALMPGDLENNPEAQQDWINAAIVEVQAIFAALEPDDTFVHLDSITVNRPVGTVDASSLGAIEPMVMALERLTTRALKSAPFLMGSSESTTETQANRQYEAYVQGIRAIQHYAEAPLERLLALALQAQGIQATVKFRFAENRASEAERDMRTQAIRLANAREAYRAGFLSQDDASTYAVGHPADVPEPRDDAASPALPASDGPVEPGLNRGVRTQRATEKVKPRGEALATVPDVVIRDADVARAIDEWNAQMPDEVSGMLDAEVVD